MASTEYIHQCILYFVISLVILKFIRVAWRFAVPRIIAYFLHQFQKKKLSFRTKKELFASLLEQAKEETLLILEVGAGSGSNFQFFPEGSKVIAVDPNPHCKAYLEAHASDWSHVQLQEVIVDKVENLQKRVPDNSVSAVVSTMTMCSVADVDIYIKEIKRMLKPGGIFYFLEHVVDSTRNSWRHIGQRLVEPLVNLVECTTLRTPWKNIDSAGFQRVKYTRFIEREKGFPFFVRPQLYGIAVKGPLN